MIKMVHSRPPVEYIVDNLFWTRTIHLIIGPSGGGKTTWVSQFLIKDWREGVPVLGFASHPKPFCYIVLDRDYYDVRKTWDDVGLTTPGEPEDFPYVIRREQPGWDNPANLAETIIHDVMQQWPKTRVLFLDGFTSLTPQGKINDYAVVSNFLLKIGRLCSDLDLTAIGLGHTAKLKKDQEIVHDRECSIGSVAFGGYTGSMIKITHDLKDPAARVLSVQPRHAAAKTLQYRFDKGLLVLEEDPTEEPERYDELKAVLLALPQGEEVEVNLLKDAAQSLRISDRSTKRYLLRFVQDGLMEHVRRGVYRRSRPS